MVGGCHHLFNLFHILYILIIFSYIGVIKYDAMHILVDKYLKS